MEINWNDCLFYDETSSTYLRWKVDRRKVKKGDKAGTTRFDGYSQVVVNGKRYLAHRVIWEIFNGKIAENHYIDHLDRNPRNNKIDNLRATTDNSKNSSMKSSNKSGVTGVSLCNNHGKFVWKASWWDEYGNRRHRQFSIEKYGNDDAFWLACEWRSGKLEQLRALGLGYTDGHGLPKGETGEDVGIASVLASDECVDREVIHF